MQKKKRVMPLPLQIQTIRNRLRKANPDVDDIDFETENLLPHGDNEAELSDWTTCLDPDLSLPENVSNLEIEFPNFNWQLPKKTKEHKGPRKSLTYTWRKTTLCADAIIVVRSQKTPDKRMRAIKSVGEPLEHRFGRLQISVPPELVGIEAKVHIEFPNAPKIQKSRRRGKHVFDTWQRFPRPTGNIKSWGQKKKEQI